MINWRNVPIDTIILLLSNIEDMAAPPIMKLIHAPYNIPIELLSNYTSILKAIQKDLNIKLTQNLCPCSNCCIDENAGLASLIKDELTN